MVLLHASYCVPKEEQRPYVFWVCFFPHDGKGEMCRHHIACEHVASVAVLSAKEELPGSSLQALLPSLVSFLGSLSVALEGFLASNELSKLWMTACHTKQLFLPAPLRGWPSTPNSCSIPTLWCLHRERVGTMGARAQLYPALPIWHYGQWEGWLCEWDQVSHKRISLVTLCSAAQWLGIYLECK